MPALGCTSATASANVCQPWGLANARSAVPAARVPQGEHAGASTCLPPTHRFHHSVAHDPQTRPVRTATSPSAHPDTSISPIAPRAVTRRRACRCRQPPPRRVPSSWMVNPQCGEPQPTHLVPPASVRRDWLRAESADPDWPRAIVGPPCEAKSSPRRWERGPGARASADRRLEPCARYHRRRRGGPSRAASRDVEDGPRPVGI